MSNKKLTIKRIGIFLLFAFVLCWILDITVYKNNDKPFAKLLTYLTMFTPAIGTIIARIITKEGWKDSFLRPNLKGNIKFYVLSIIIPLLAALIYGLLLVAFYNRNFQFSDIFDQTAPISFLGMLLTLISTLIPFSFYTLGEELGWRAYLVPKLETLFGTTASLLIGGAIWGLWHTPAIVNGLNYGKDYTSYPFGGIAMMCICCIFEGCILTWLTKRTGSVYPAAIMHCISNNVSPFIYGQFLTQEIVDQHGFALGCIYNIPMIVLGIVAYVMILRCKRKAQY